MMVHPERFEPPTPAFGVQGYASSEDATGRLTL